MAPTRSEFAARYRFPLDRFQSEALDALDAGEHVVVAAPTGSGKTVVAEYGIERALARGGRAFYTAPIKALSNQKYRDLVGIHGDDRVGLLTGDNSINAGAPVVVMTTEVLRNMIYGRSPALDGLVTVVLDEVHFLQDTYRGPVWEEVIIHLRSSVQLVCLSATVSNSRELAEWITTVRGSTRSVLETRRPVRLDNRYLVADLTADRLRFMPMFVGGVPNKDARRLDDSAIRRGPPRGRRPARQRHDPGKKKLATPRRLETVEVLSRRDLLPTIYFIFSRAACDDAARICADSGLVLTTGDERAEIQQIVDERLAPLDRDDLEVLGIDRFREQLTAGFAAHHAGMVPAMKEVVEACFTAGLVKVVFATETLAVGINMPARSVVIEKLTKFTGDHHQRLTPGEYTQLTGRAGRRGIDDVGDAVVLWTPWVRFDEIAELAGSTSFHLRSAFRPTYNMAANLVRSYGSEEAHHLLNLSFAQFQADRDIVRLEARLERRRQALLDSRADAASPFGDIDEYRRSTQAEKDDREARRAASAGEMRGALAKLRPGWVIRTEAGKPAAVIASAHRKNGVRLTLVDVSGRRFYADKDDFDDPPSRVGTIAMPRTFAPNRKDWLREIGRRLKRADLDPDPTRRERLPRGAPSVTHPVTQDPDLPTRLRAAAHADRIEREITDIERRVRNKSHSLAQDFDHVLDLLAHLGYVDREQFELTSPGETLARVFHESDLLVAEVVRLGVLDGLGAADVAAIVSCLVYEHRSPDAPPNPWFSSTTVRGRWRRLQALSEDLAALERARGLPEHRPPDPTFAATAHAWVAGEGFAEVVEEEELTGGDFVRTTKQLIDLLRQIALVAPDKGTRSAAASAADAADRGVVADTSVAP